MRRTTCLSTPLNHASSIGSTHLHSDLNKNLGSDCKHSIEVYKISELNGDALLAFPMLR